MRLDESCVAYRENGVFVNDEDTKHRESNRLSTQPAQKHAHLQHSSQHTGSFNPTQGT